MKKFKYIILAAVCLSFFSCKIDEIVNPNGPSIEGVLLDASKSQLQTLVTGSEDLLRQEVGFYYDVTSIVGREYYFMTGSDPRYTGELLGKGESMLDRAGFYGTRPYYGRYRTIKNLNVLIESAQNSSVLTGQELNGYLGFAKTFQAYEMHLAANLQYDNGIRVDVVDAENLGPFVSHSEALSAVQSLLDAGLADLNNAGDAFSFNLSAAMAGFDTPSTFATFNRALAARISIYQGNKGDAISDLGDSFMDSGAAASMGPARYYSAAGGDFANNLFRVPDQADAIIVHPSHVADAEAGDARLGWALLRPSGSLELDGLTGEYDVWVYQSNEAYVPYITNEELMLINAEANIGTNNAAAETALNAVRTNAGLGAYTGATTDDALVAELIKQRRYSLFGQGHRWVDMRRWGLLDQLPLDRDGDDVWQQMPRPISEPL